MFTGLIEEIGKVLSVTKSTKSARIKIQADEILKDVRLGDSICTNGVCLTVTEFSGHSFCVDVMAETMRRSNLHLLSSGDHVNLERALKAGDRLGGHIVSGHIDGMGRITDYMQEDNAVWVTVTAEENLLKYIIEKGSVAIDGISLTVAYVEEDSFQVSVIPHTKEETTLLKKRVGDVVNLECDMFGKYIEKLLFSRDQAKQQAAGKKKLDMNFLYEHGFASINGRED